MTRRCSMLGLSALLLVTSAACGAGDQEVSESGAAELGATTADLTRAANERAFLLPAYRAYDATTASIPGDPILDYRTDCSRALIAGLVLPTVDQSTPAGKKEAADLVARAEARIRRVADNVTPTKLDGVTSGRHVFLAPAVDCLLATAALAPELDKTRVEGRVDTTTLVADHARELALWAFGPANDTTWYDPGCAPDRHDRKAQGWARPACFQQLQRENIGDSQTEEAGLSAALAYLVRILVPLAGTDVTYASLLERGGWLMTYALSPGDQATQGTPFPATGLATNHQMRPNPYYAGGALLSLGDILATHRQLAKADVPVGFAKTRVLDVLREIFGSVTAQGRYTGAFEFVGQDGAVRAGEGMRFDDLETIFATEESWSTPRSPFIPADGVGATARAGRGTISEYVHPVTKNIRVYQYNGADVRGMECDTKWLPGVGRCDARQKLSLNEQWGAIGNQASYGGFAMPVDRVDAAPQWATADGLIRARVFRGDRFWQFTCTPTTSGTTCTADLSRTLAEHFATLDDLGGWNGAPAPTSDLDAVSVLSNPTTGVVQRYYFKGNRLWQERCDPGQSCRKQATNTLAGQWGGMMNNPAPGDPARLPEDRVDAVTQFIVDGTISTYLFRDNLSWKYTCTGGVCTYVSMTTLEDRWSSVLGQERFARKSPGALVRGGVTDWGLDATSVFNSAYALGAVLEDAPLTQRYDGMQGQQRSEQRDAKTYFPTFYAEGSGWSFGPAATVTAPAAASLGYTAAGWWPRDFCARLGMCDLHQRTRADNALSVYWLNVFAARNHAVAYLMQASSGVLHVIKH